MKTILLPFRFDAGRVADTSDADTIVRQKIVDYLTTSSRERFDLIDYGMNIKQFLFEAIDSLVLADLKTDIIPGLQRYVSGVTILDIFIEQSEVDPSIAEITVEYALPLSTPKSYTFTIAGDLNEETPI